MRFSYAEISNLRGFSVVGNNEARARMLALLVLATVTFAWLLTSHAQMQSTQRPAVSAELRSSQAVVGEAVQLTLTVQGGAADAVPEMPVVDGLEFQFAGQQMRTEVNNFNISTKIQYTYLVTPTRPGTFEIPGIDVRVSGRNYRTQPLTLTAVAPGQKGSGSTLGRSLWGEVKLAKPEAYVGEPVPVEFRFYFDRNVNGGLESLAEFQADGFSFEKIGEPLQEFTVANGKNVLAFVYRTAITPAKAGKLKIGPVRQSARVQVIQQSRPRRSPRSIDPFDQGAFDDFFNSFFDDPGLGIPIIQRVTITAEAAELNVRPIPTKDAPASYAGAVGQFDMKTSAEPLRMNMGEPVTLSLAISGTGNFTGFEKPLLSSTRGWRDYPPTARFVSDGESPNSGSKIIELVLTAQEGVRNLPTAEFSYFDPVVGKFKILKSEPLPVEVLNAPAPPPTPAATEPSTASPPAAVAAPAPAPQDADKTKTETQETTAAAKDDIHYLTVEEPTFAPLPKPLEQSRRFLLINASMALAAVFLAAALWWRGHTPSPAALQRRKLRAAAQAIAHLEKAPLSKKQVCEQAYALLRNIDTQNFDDRLPASLRDASRRILDIRNEQLFSGATVESQAIDPAERASVLATLRALQKEGLLSA
jgi:hypothetical protein